MGNFRRKKENWKKRILPKRTTTKTIKPKCPECPTKKQQKNICTLRYMKNLKKGVECICPNNDLSLLNAEDLGWLNYNL